MLTGTGLAQPNTPKPPEDHHRRHDERSHGIDVHQRVEGEASSPLGRVIAEESSHPPVRDLVENDRRDDHQEEDDLLRRDVVVGHQGDEQHRAPDDPQGALGVLIHGTTTGRSSPGVAHLLLGGIDDAERAIGMASSLASPMGLPQASHTP